jgi:F0F1-type ATP synthase assembly protein I
MKPDRNPLSAYGLVAGIVGQVGCFLTLIAGGSVILGLLLDRVLGTKPLFLFLFLLGSIPLNLWAVYRYTRYKATSLQASLRKEDEIRED